MHLRQAFDGRGLTYRKSGSELTGVDDANFIVGLIAQLQIRYAVDSHRVYVTGASNGGMMSLRLACEAAPHFAAVAAIIASLPQPIYARCEPDVPMSLLLMNGTADPWVPVRWRSGTHLPPRRRRRGRDETDCHLVCAA